MADLFAFTEEQVERLMAMLHVFESGSFNQQVPPDVIYPGYPLFTRLALTLEDIPPIFANIPGTGDVVIEAVDDDTTEIDDSEAGTIETALNIGTGPILAGTYVALVRDPFSGSNIAIQQCCGAEVSSSSSSSSSSESESESQGSGGSGCPPGFTSINVVTDVSCDSDGGLDVTFTSICVPA